MTCPHCGGDLALLSVVSSVSVVDYYGCQACNKLSERPKGTTGDPVPLPMLPLAARPHRERRATA